MTYRPVKIMILAYRRNYLVLVPSTQSLGDMLYLLELQSQPE
jgi:hypothetical protein